MSTAPTTLDSIAAILVLIILTASVLTLFGMGILMAIGALSHRPLVTSWPPDQEQSFAAYESRGAKANSQAWTFGLIGAVVVAILATGVYFGVEPEMKDITKDMNMSNLTKKREAAAPKPDPAPQAESTPPARSAPPAEAPQPDTTAPAAAPQQ